MNNEELKKALLNSKDYEVSKTYYRAATMYVMQDGTCISFGYDNKTKKRYEDHRSIFSCFKNIKYNDWKKLFKTTKILGYSPETNTAFCLREQVLTEEQNRFIKRYNVELLRDQL